MKKSLTLFFNDSFIRELKRTKRETGVSMSKQLENLWLYKADLYGREKKQ